MQYCVLKKLVNEGSGEGQEDTVQVPRELFLKLLAGALRSRSAFDPEFYMTMYDDIRQAVESGVLASAEHHYLSTGYFEDRFPAKIIVDERFYLANNPDVAAAMKRGEIRSAQEHFETAGFYEGRSPHREFSLF